MNRKKENQGLSRRSFFKLTAAGSLGALILPSGLPESIAQALPAPKPATNIADALKYPRTQWSLPGKYAGKVIKATHQHCIENGKILQEPVNQMLEKSMLALTDARTIKAAWRVFVKPEETVGLKLNPIGGKLLSTSHELVRCVIEQLTKAGIKKNKIVLWDRREFQLHEAGFTPDAYPGITITGTEKKDADGSFIGKDGRLFSEDMIDKDWYYWADIEGDYDDYTLPYMVNKGKYSYFSKICTQQVDKIINMPILKNAGTSITLCLKNLGYGVITNTGRLHKELWGETSAEVPCFPPVRDKVVLNIADGLIGCFNGGPGANPQFICNYNTLLLGTDPVAVDRIGYDMILAKRIAEGVQQEDVPRSRRFMEYAQELGIGVADREAIHLKEIHLT